MKRTVIYETSRSEFEDLLPALKNAGYKINGYLGSEELTIDDGTSTSFAECSNFSTLTLSMSDDSHARIEVKNSELMRAINSHFKTD